MRFAVIENNIVTNVILADSLEAAEQITGKTCLETNEENVAHIGLGLNGTTFEQPVPEPTDITPSFVEE